MLSFNSGRAAENKDSYLNLHSVGVDGLRARFESVEIDIPQVAKQVSQAVSLTYRYNLRGNLQLERRDEMWRCGQQGPDRADALAIALSRLVEHGMSQALIITSKNTWANLRRTRRERPRLRY